MSSFVIVVSEVSDSPLIYSSVHTLGILLGLKDDVRDTQVTCDNNIKE